MDAAKEKSWGAGIVNGAKAIPSLSIVIAIAVWWANQASIHLDANHFENVLILAAILFLAYVFTGAFDAWFDGLVRPKGSSKRRGLLLHLWPFKLLEDARNRARIALGRESEDDIYAWSQSVALGTEEWTKRIEPFRAHSRTFRTLGGLLLVAGPLCLASLLPVPPSLVILQESWSLCLACWVLALCLIFPVFFGFRVIHMLHLYRFIGKATCFSTLAKSFKFDVLSDESKPTRTSELEVDLVLVHVEYNLKWVASLSRGAGSSGVAPSTAHAVTKTELS